MWSRRALALCALAGCASAATALAASALAAAGRGAAGGEDSPAERPAELSGLYRMEAPEAVRPSARLRSPATEVTFLRLVADGRSRQENVTIHDRGGAAAATVETGPWHRQAWEVRVSRPLGRAAAALARLCFEHAGRLACERYERDAVTGDLTLFAGAAASSATLRLERVRTR